LECSTDWTATGSMISGLALALAVLIAYHEYNSWHKKQKQRISIEANGAVYNAIALIEYAMGFENQHVRNTERYSAAQIANKKLPENFSDQICNISNYREYMLSRSKDWARVKSLRDQCTIHHLQKSNKALCSVLEAKARLDGAAMGILNFYDRQAIGIKDEAYPSDSRQYQLGLLFFGGQLFQDRNLPSGNKKYADDFHKVFELLKDGELNAVESLSN
jgi:hypothetical protein